MYPSSSSSSHSSMAPGGGAGDSRGGSLIRYDSAPGSFLTAAVDSVIGQPRTKEFSPLGWPTSDTSAISSESNCKTTTSDQRSNNYGLKERGFGNGASPSSPLVRHSSLPAAFLNRLASAASTDNGFSVTRGIGSYSSKGASDGASGIQRLNSQLSFTRQDSLSQITEESEDGDDDIHAEGHRKSAHSYATANFAMGSWDNSSTIMFSAPPGKRAKNDISGGINMVGSQFQFGLSQTALDMSSMENMIDIPHDSVPCKARAKRGCATHPRSIAERERRTRISGKLKKLQDLVPNMDKMANLFQFDEHIQGAFCYHGYDQRQQTSYADMLDLAVQHIKGLQTQVQILNTELDRCTCGCKKNTQCGQ